MLHILNKPPSSDAAQHMLEAMSGGDTVVLIEDAAQAALYPEWLGWKTSAASIYLLTEDVLSRGLYSAALSNNLPLIELGDFVALTEQHEKIVSWY
ncbi:sulfurtransferase complex subunit TusB [Vreelandella nigrificans]|uniref:Sulfurtransferase complex subunit TusB n=1 Tax=Vreelandella nigrificans TaxID=2042704 RepID=A0A2A4HTB4_9GAMM|nr:sulfurtransferase complex subunit TusB [Halomonas nigrificans]PCF97647.1 sulfurtransferase complex subunit TusB [Halomonas nigrificans]